MQKSKSSSSRHSGFVDESIWYDSSMTRFNLSKSSLTLTSPPQKGHEMPLAMSIEDLLPRPHERCALTDGVHRVEAEALRMAEIVPQHRRDAVRERRHGLLVVLREAVERRHDDLPGVGVDLPYAHDPAGPRERTQGHV